MPKGETYGKNRETEKKEAVSRGRTSSNGTSLFFSLPLLSQRGEIDGGKRQQAVIKQPNEFVALLRTVSKRRPGFVVENLLFQICQRSF